MNDMEVWAAVMGVVGLFVVGAALLYLFTSRGERPGFHVAPANADEWAHYGFRSLILGVVSLMLTYPHRGGGELVALGSVLLLGSSFAFWKTERRLCVTAFLLSVTAFLWLLLFPPISWSMPA